MMRFPSAGQLLRQLSQVLQRFPMTVFSSLLGTGVFIYYQHLHYPYPDWCFRLLMTSLLALPLTLSVHLLSERLGAKQSVNFGLQALAVLLLMAYYFTLPADLDLISNVRFCLFWIGLHLLVAVIPYSPASETEGFWQYNKVLFLRILLAFLYAGVLFVGMAIALLAVDQLFGVDIRSKWYATLAGMVFGLFNTCFFLAGVPARREQVKGGAEYPKGLLVFTQFVLLPLVTLYLAILYLYSAKIILRWTLPKGWVSYLVLGFSIVGILSLLLIYPIRQREGNRWIQTFARWFYLALFPLVVLLLVAIGERVGAYGITENRYLVLVLAIWLLSVALYFLLSARKNIYWIPASLCLLSFVISAGPWSVFAVAERSQLARFETLLQKNLLLEKGKITATGKKLKLKDNQQITALLDYFISRGHTDVLQPYFSQNLSRLDTLHRYSRARELHRLAGLHYVDEYAVDTAEVVSSYYFQYPDDNDGELETVRGYDYRLTLDTNQPHYDRDGKRLGGETYEHPYVYGKGAQQVSVQLDSSLTVLKLYRGSSWLLTLDLGPRIEKLSRQFPESEEQVQQSDMIWVLENEHCKVRLRMNHLRFQVGAGHPEDVDYGAELLLGLKSVADAE